MGLADNKWAHGKRFLYGSQVGPGVSAFFRIGCLKDKKVWMNSDPYKVTAEP